jgi:hypothetical protein
MNKTFHTFYWAFMVASAIAILAWIGAILSKNWQQITGHESHAQSNVFQSTNCWCDGVTRMELQDETGQVYSLWQEKKNSNLYSVFKSMDETNGITNSFSWRIKQSRGSWKIYSNHLFIVTNKAVQPYKEK